MISELSCHLVDFISLPSVSVSLTLGYLQAFAQADPRIGDRCQFSQQCRYVEGDLETAWLRIRDLIRASRAEKHVFGFTNYFWNRPSNIELAHRIKAAMPGALIVFGGNEVTNQGDVLLHDPAIDVVVNGEGEVVFTNLLAAYLDGTRHFSQVQGISFRDESGTIITTLPQPRIDNLDSIPSPFLSGACDVQDVKTSREVVYEFSRGCPFKCAFCFWGTAVGTKTRRFSFDRIQADLEFLVSNLENGSRLWVADANFGMVEADVQIAELLAGMVHKHNKRIFMFTNWAKNTSRRVVKAATILYNNHLISGMTLSAQSINPDVLELAERKNIPFEYYQQLQEEFHKLGIPTYTELLLGMPGETYDSFRDGVDKIISVGGTPFIYPLLLLNNTEYSDPEMRSKHGIRSRHMPYYMYNSTTLVETVIGHDKLPYKDWLRGVGLRLAVPLFYCGILKFIMTRLHAVCGLSYGEMFDVLLDYCIDGKIRSFPLFSQVFANYMASWDSAGNYDAPLISGILEGSIPRDTVHYQALMKVLANDPEAATALVDELTQELFQAVEAGPLPDFQDWLEYQQLLVEAISRVVQHGAIDLQTGLDRTRLAEYLGEEVPADAGSTKTRLEIRPEYRNAPFDVFVFRISYGSVDTLRLLRNATTTPSEMLELQKIS